MFDRLVQIEPRCANLPKTDVVKLAHELHGDGCRVETALWIAIKWTGLIQFTPRSDLMARAANVSQDTLVLSEIDDLKKLDWNIAPCAIRCNLMT
jgi:hypothetical protein